MQNKIILKYFIIYIVDCWPHYCIIIIKYVQAQNLWIFRWEFAVIRPRVSMGVPRVPAVKRWCRSTNSKGFITEPFQPFVSSILCIPPALLKPISLKVFLEAWIQATASTSSQLFFWIMNYVLLRRGKEMRRKVFCNEILEWLEGICWHVKCMKLK